MRVLASELSWISYVPRHRSGSFVSDTPSGVAKGGGSVGTPSIGSRPIDLWRLPCAAGRMPPPHIPMFRSLQFCGESGEYGLGVWPLIAWAHAASASITRRMANRPCRFNRCSCNAAARPRRAWPPIGLALLFLPFATRELTGSTSSPASRCRQGIAGTRIAHANYPLRARLKDSPPRRSPLASMSDRDK